MTNNILTCKRYGYAVTELMRKETIIEHVGECVEEAMG